MKKSLITLLLLTNVLLLQAQNASIEAEIRKLEEREYTAILKGDAVSLQTIWSADFTVNAPTNQVNVGSATVINLIKAGAIKYSTFKREIEKIIVQGDIVISMGNEVVVPVGKNPKAGQTIKRRYTNIWRKQNGSWKMVARHANEICN